MSGTMRRLLAAVVWGGTLGMATTSTCAAAEAAKEQFSSVVYVRVAGATDEQYRELAPDTFVHGGTLDGVRAWGGRYVYRWYNDLWFQPKAEPAPKPDDPNAYVEPNQGLWENWDAYRAAGVVTGDRPGKLEDLLYVSEAYARAQRDGKPLPERSGRFYQGRTVLCIANPDVRRILADITRFNCSHAWKGKVNGGFTDLDYCPQDFSEFTRKRFEAHVRAVFPPDRIRQVLQADPDKPIPMVPPTGAGEDLERIYRVLRAEVWNTIWPEHIRAMRDAADEVMGKGAFHIINHGEAYRWRTSPKAVMNMIWWEDVHDSYCCEAGTWPGAQYAQTYAGPEWILEVPSNLYDYQYGAGRLWGEPVMVKTAYAGTLHSRAIAELGFAEGTALLGNMGAYASGGDEPKRASVPASWLMPMVKFAHEIAPQVRTMIPAGRVGLVYSPVDQFARMFENDQQCFQLSDILRAQHVPFQVVHLQILDRVLAERKPDVLVLPSVRFVKDEQAATLRKFVEDGGKALFIDECGGYTWEGVKRPESAFKNLLPEADAARVTVREVGRGRTARIAAPVSAGSLESGQAVQRALFQLLDATPSLASPGQYPVLLLNLTRNSNNSRFWLHLLNYDVNLDTPGDAVAPVRTVENLRVVVPLPGGLRAKAATLYRQGSDALKLDFEPGREGCAVTVPRVNIYALLAVDTEPGDRPATALLRPATVDEAVDLVARSMHARPTGRTLVPVPGATSAGGEMKPRRFMRTVVAYASGKDGGGVRLQLRAESRSAEVVAYASDGALAVSQRVPADETATLTAPPTSGHHTLVIDPGSRFTVAFPDAACAMFEASAKHPLCLDEPGDSPPLYFYVPAKADKFTLSVNTRADRARVYPVHIVVKSPGGAAAFEQTGAVDGLKSFAIAVPEGAAGRVWSIEFLSQPAAGSQSKGFVQFRLEGIPPLVASSPAQLRVVAGEE